FQAQMRVAAAGVAFLGVLVEAALGHDVDADVLSRHVLRTAWADAVKETEIGAVLSDPLRPVRTVLDIGHALLEVTARSGGEQVGRHPRHIEMAIGRDSAVLHAVFPAPVSKVPMDTVLLRSYGFLAKRVLRAPRFCAQHMS